jgi:hypothetical protein
VSNGGIPRSVTSAWDDSISPRLTVQVTVVTRAQGGEVVLVLHQRGIPFQICSSSTVSSIEGVYVDQLTNERAGEIAGVRSLRYIARPRCPSARPANELNVDGSFTSSPTDATGPSACSVRLGSRPFQVPVALIPIDRCPTDPSCCPHSSHEHFPRYVANGQIAHD